MELKAMLQSPFSETERYDFIIKYNYELNYTIKDFEDRVEAWGYTEEELKEIRKQQISKLSCTKRVLALILQDKGIDYFEQVLPLIEKNKQAKLEWELCGELERSNPLLDIIGKELNLSTEDIDNIFILANLGTVTTERSEQWLNS